MAASLSFLSFTPQSISVHRSASTGEAAGSASSLYTPAAVKPLPKLVFALSSAGVYSQSTSRFIRNVAFSSELDEEVHEEEGENFDFTTSREPSFSADLKLFVGNFPFTVDSTGLAGLFEQAGNVEMVEEEAEVIEICPADGSAFSEFFLDSSAKEVRNAVRSLDGIDLNGRLIQVRAAESRPKRLLNF